MTPPHQFIDQLNVLIVADDAPSLFLLLILNVVLIDRLFDRSVTFDSCALNTSGGVS